MADITKEIKDFQSAIYGKDVRKSMVSLAQKINEETEGATGTVASYEQAETNRVNAEIQRDANEKKRVSEFANLKKESESATLAANNVTETVQKKLDNGEFVGPQGIQGKQGEPFQVAKVYESIAAMNNGYATDGVKVGQFVVINTGNVEDEDNAKLFLKGITAYDFITDMSGAQGIQGPQGPQGIQGKQGKQGEPGTVENIEQYPVTYTEPESDDVPASGGTLGGIVGWVVKKIKSLTSSVTQLNSKTSLVYRTNDVKLSSYISDKSSGLYTEMGNMGIFGGFILLKAGTYKNTDVLFTLPSRKSPNGIYFMAGASSNAYIMKINGGTGNVVFNSTTTTFSTDTYLFLSAAFKIN